jgi:hypothetical protein
MIYIAMFFCGGAVVTGNDLLSLLALCVLWVHVWAKETHGSRAS